MKFWPQFGWWRSWISSVRTWLRNWLGIEGFVTVGDLTQLRRDMEAAHSNIDKSLMAWKPDVQRRLLTLDSGMDALHTEDQRLEGLIRETAEGLQQQIVELGSTSGPLVNPPKTSADDPKTLIDPGFRRFTSRKRDWERAHSQPKTTETGKQIEENHRLIASGTRKADG